jgi:hypothetical protein
MLEATSYGLIALGVILVAAFCFVWVEERAGLQAYRPSSLADERNVNLLRTAGALAVNRSRRESVGREELTESVLAVSMISPDANSPLRDCGPAGVSHG